MSCYAYVTYERTDAVEMWVRIRSPTSMFRTPPAMDMRSVSEPTWLARVITFLRIITVITRTWFRRL